MKRYEVVEVVKMTVQRERRWHVEAISEQDAIRQIADRESCDEYAGERRIMLSSEPMGWRVDGNDVDYEQGEAVPQADDFADIGGAG
ncbi:MAG: hypothetical protein D8M59_02430 [Planctomycetes bacterium]|nr:hypothetical protein [Planctomycetota bacterium]NOG54424.1 hypothetical protein [Planctomycetota bacterium]